MVKSTVPVEMFGHLLAGIQTVAEVYSASTSSVPAATRSMLADIAARLELVLDAPVEPEVQVNGVGDSNPFTAAAK